MEETLWNLEDKWKLSTQKAIAIFATTSFLLIAICAAAAAWRRRRRDSVHQEPCKTKLSTNGTAAEAPRLKVLLESVRWSRRSKWEEGERGRERESPTPLLVKREFAGEGAWQSHNSTSAVWQRPILMGEKCELPRFSGIILYDQRGIPLHQYQQGMVYDQEVMAAQGTTLRDLL